MTIEPKLFVQERIIIDVERISLAVQEYSVFVDFADPESDSIHIESYENEADAQSAQHALRTAFTLLIDEFERGLEMPSDEIDEAGSGEDVQDADVIDSPPQGDAPLPCVPGIPSAGEGNQA